MTDIDDDIPTLTTIIRRGQKDMKDQFDEMESQTDTRLPDEVINHAVEQEAELESDKLETESIASRNELKQQIDQAINDILPEVETHLKQALYKRFGLE